MVALGMTNISQSIKRRCVTTVLLSIVPFLRRLAVIQQSKHLRIFEHQKEEVRNEEFQERSVMISRSWSISYFCRYPYEYRIANDTYNKENSETVNVY